MHEEAALIIQLCALLPCLWYHRYIIVSIIIILNFEIALILRLILNLYINLLRALRMLALHLHWTSSFDSLLALLAIGLNLLQLINENSLVLHVALVTLVVKLAQAFVLRHVCCTIAFTRWWLSVSPRWERFIIE